MVIFCKEQRIISLRNVSWTQIRCSFFTVEYSSAVEFNPWLGLETLGLEIGRMVWQSEVSPEWLCGVGVWGCFAETPLSRLWHYTSLDSVPRNTNGVRFPDARRQGCIRLTIFSHSVANGQFMSGRLKKMSLNSKMQVLSEERIDF